MSYTKIQKSLKSLNFDGVIQKIKIMPFLRHRVVGLTQPLIRTKN